MSERDPAPTEASAIATLERLDASHVWVEIAPRHGVTNPLPPWKSRLDGMCDALDAAEMTLGVEDRRGDEDRLGQTLYAHLPAPERQLVALAHSLVARGVIAEAELAARMATVRARLNAA